MFNWFSKPDPKDEQRQADRELRKVSRDIERDRRQLERDEKKLEQEIKKLAKEGNAEGAKILAKQLINLRKQKNRSYVATSKIQEVSAQNKAMGANIKLSNAMGVAGKTMGDMNRLMKPEQLASNINSFTRESQKIEMTDEMISDTLDDFLTESGDEEEGDNIIAGVLDEIGIEINEKMANVPISDIQGNDRNKSKVTDDDIEKQLARLKVPM